jgi:hypothetical protein
LRQYTERELTHVPPALAANLPHGHTASSGSGDAGKRTGSRALVGTALSAEAGAVPVPPTMFPIIVVLETAGEEEVGKCTDATATPGGGGAAAAAAAAAGGGGEASFQLQCTYATLAHRDSADDLAAASIASSSSDGAAAGCHVSREWTVRPLKQKVQVGDKAYELHELYGIDGARAAAATASSAGGGSASGSAGAPAAGSGAAARTLAEQSLAAGSECVVCLTEPRDTVVLPCRHLCLCDDCAQQLRFATNKCPVCRAREWMRFGRRRRASGEPPDG